MSRPGTRSSGGISFSSRETRDLVVAWLALGLAFTLFLLVSSGRGLGPVGLLNLLGTGLFVELLVLSLLTAGVGFLLHELAHKVVAVRFGQVAEFRADYTMLGLALAAALVGFLFAAPGAVYHRGRITPRESAGIAVAGPLTNVVLAGLFLPLFLFTESGFLHGAGQLGVTLNAVLAGFNMIPFGPLDGRKVLRWSTVGFGASFLLCAGVAVASFLFVGFPL
ncbi:MAG: metalloprotease [Haloglomus sp.]